MTAHTQDRSKQVVFSVLRIIDKEESSSCPRTDLIYMRAQTTRDNTTCDSRAVTLSPPPRKLVLKRSFCSLCLCHHLFYRHTRSLRPRIIIQSCNRDLAWPIGLHWTVGNPMATIPTAHAPTSAPELFPLRGGHRPRDIHSHVEWGDVLGRRALDIYHT